MSPSFYVYMMFRPNGVPCYIGKGTGKRHRRMDRPHNAHLQRIIERAGGRIASIKLAEQLTEAEAHQIEVQLIAIYGRERHGGILVNATDGGEGLSGRQHSEASKRKMSENRRGNTRERFLSHVDKSGPIAPNMTTRCWIWTGHLNDQGYGKVHLTGYSALAARAAHNLFVGPCPPKPMEIELACGNHACVSPDHIQFLTHWEKGARGMSIPARNASKTHCKRGHPLDERNTYRPAASRGRATKRECRACKAVHHKTYMAKHGDKVRARALAGYHARKNGEAA